MTEEQIKQKFKETYPDFMLGDEPLSPYFDIWEYAIETATNELQEENGKLRSKIDNLLEYKTLYRQNTCKKRFFISTNPSVESSSAMPCYTDRKCAECPRYSAVESQ